MVLSAKKPVSKEKDAFARRSDEAPIDYGPLPERNFCAVCRKASGVLLRCRRCKVMWYCSKEHQTEHYAQHSQICSTIARESRIVATEERKLRNFEGNGELPAGNLFDFFLGYFWSFPPAAEYTRARATLAAVYGEVDPPTRAAVEAQLHHNLAVVRLCQNDDMMLSELAPAMMMRLGRAQECFDFLKWWKTTGDRDRGVRENRPILFLDLHGADPFAPMSHRYRPGFNLAQHVSMALLRIRILLDLRRVLAAGHALAGRLPPEIVGQIRGYVPWTSIVAADRAVTRGEPDAWVGRLDRVREEAHTLCEGVRRANPHFFPKLLAPGNIFALQPRDYKDGSVEHAAIPMMCTYRAWIETPGAVEFIRKREAEACETTEAASGKASTLRGYRLPWTSLG